MRGFQVEACPNDLWTDPFPYRHHFVNVSPLSDCLPSEFCLCCPLVILPPHPPRKGPQIPLLLSSPCSESMWRRHLALLLPASLASLPSRLCDAFVFVSQELVTVSGLFAGFCTAGTSRSSSGAEMRWGPCQTPALLFAGCVMIPGMLRNFSEPLLSHARNHRRC